jgi:hypothetical protein
MALRRAAILAIGLVGALAGVALSNGGMGPGAAKGDLPAIPRSDARFMTVETRDDGVSTLTRVELGDPEAGSVQ